MGDPNGHQKCRFQLRSEAADVLPTTICGFFQLLSLSFSLSQSLRASLFEPFFGDFDIRPNRSIVVLFHVLPSRGWNWNPFFGLSLGLRFTLWVGGWAFRLGVLRHAFLPWVGAGPSFSWLELGVPSRGWALNAVFKTYGVQSCRSANYWQL